MVSTDASFIMSAQYQAMQVKINSLKAAGAAAISVVKLPDTPKNDKQNDNNIATTAACLYKQRSVSGTCTTIIVTPGVLILQQIITVQTANGRERTTIK